MVIGDLDHFFVHVLCRFRHVDAVHPLHARTPASGRAWFECFSWRGFLVGLMESFLYGAYAGLIFVPIYNFLQRKWEKII